jgi:hypothetical protein
MKLKEMKYLGIYFNNRLNFYTYIEHTTEKSRKMIYVFGKTTKLNGSLGHKSLKTIYEETLVLLITYEATVWEEAIEKQRFLRKMQGNQSLIKLLATEFHI